MKTYEVRLVDGTVEFVRGVRKVRAINGTLCFHAPEDADTFVYGPLIRGYSLAHIVSWERAQDGDEVPKDSCDA